MSEDEFVVETHDGFGRWIRNNWGLWGGSRLNAYFYSLGIYHPKDMSGIILTSYYRHLTNKRIRLNKQIKSYQAFWSSSRVKPRFEARTSEDSLYTDLETALTHADSIIEISFLGYEKLPSKWKKFKNLNSLTIEKCPNLDFPKIFKSIANFENLTELYLFENHISMYPPTLGAIFNLEVLWVLGDSLSRLPNEIKNLTHLRELAITECPNIDLDLLFDMLVDVGSLREMDLTDNGLLFIPFEISNLVQLTDVWLDGNRLSKVPEGVKSLPNLSRLSLFNNNLEKLNLAADDFQTLTSINLCYNNFDTFPMELKYIRNLERVMMWYNEISTIPQEINQLKRLKYLDLHHNNLTDEQKEELRLQLIETELRL